MKPSYKILVVDDEVDLCKAIAQAFKIKGHSTQTAFNGQTAFETIRSQPLDVIISDIRMPGWSGVDLLKAIKTLPAPTPLVAMMSGFSDVSEKELYELGADLFINKPFSVLEFIKAVELKISERTSAPKS